MDVELAAAHKIVAERFKPTPAGPYAGDIRVLMEVNNVGGANIGMTLTAEVQRAVMQVTVKEFTGNIRQLASGENPEFAGHATGLFFRPGSIEVMGARSPDLVRLLIHQICRRLREFGYSPSIVFMSIDNRVTTGNLGSYVALERVNDNLPGFSTKYDPTCFPGVICTYTDTHKVVTFLVFENGKVMGLGINDLYTANLIYLTLVAVIQRYRADSSLEHQRNKSFERKARKDNEAVARVGRGMYARAQAIGLEVQQFLEANRSSIGTTDFAVTLKSKLNEISATVEKKHHADEDVEPRKRMRSLDDADITTGVEY